MFDTRPAPRSGEGVLMWLIKIFTGLFIIIVLFIHFVVNHYIADGPGGLLSYEDVVEYFSNPIIPIMEIFFLVLVVAHSLIGLRGIILDLNPSRRVMTGINWLLSIVGVVAVVYGIWLTITIVSQG